MLNNFTENGLIIPENLIKNCSNKSNIVMRTKRSNKILFKAASSFHDISVCENDKGRFLQYGLSIQAGIINTALYKGNIPYLNYFLQTYFLKQNAKKILVIGFGIGLLVKQFETIFNNLKQIDAVDIEENIMTIATKYFNFTPSDKFNLYLQDALVYLRNNKTKYDIIIVDVAGNEGIDARFFEDEFFINIKKSLNKTGILAFNSCANIDFSESDKTFFGFTIKQYKKYFKNFAVFNGKTSDEITFKTLYNMDKNIFDITNAIFIASDKKLNVKNFACISKDDLSKVKSLNVEISPYTNDLHKIYDISIAPF